MLIVYLLYFVFRGKNVCQIAYTTLSEPSWNGWCIFLAILWPFHLQSTEVQHIIFKIFVAIGGFLFQLAEKYLFPIIAGVWPFKLTFIFQFFSFCFCFFMFFLVHNGIFWVLLVVLFTMFLLENFFSWFCRSHIIWTTSKNIYRVSYLLFILIFLPSILLCHILIYYIGWIFENI